MVRLALLPALVSLAWPAGDALADNCSLTLLNSVSLTVADNIAWVPGSVGSTQREFQIATAAPDNQMGKDALADFGLRAIDYTPNENVGGAAFNLGTAAMTGIDGSALGRSYGSMIGGGAASNGIAIYDSRGRVYHSLADARPFTLGSMRSDHLEFVVTDNPQPGSGGMLSANFFRRYDVDLNFAAHRLNMFSSDHCKGQVVYWRAPGVAALPFRYQNGRIMARVVVDGREMDAVIDTGSPRSEMLFDDVDSFFYRNSKSRGVVREDDGESAYNFGVLSFGTVAIYNPHLVLTHSTGISAAGPQTGTLLRNTNQAAMKPALTIGTDLLKRLHLYIAFNERMLYVTQGPELAADDAKALPVVDVKPARP
jgi:hypothetical protein